MPAPKIIPRYSVGDYQQWDGDWELWDGIPIAMTPSPFGDHQRLLAKLAQRFLNALETAGCDACELVIELDWIVDPHTVVRPDLSIICSGNLQRYIEQPPRLIVEILSPATSRRDRVEKRALYEQQGVQDYLLVEPANGATEYHSLRADGHYQVAGTAIGEGLFELSEGCQIKVDFERL